MIGDDIELIVTRIERDSVRLAIKASRDVRILRGELLDREEAPSASVVETAAD